MLELKDYSLTIENKVLLENINMKFGKGIYLFVGPNGIGKTSFAKALINEYKYDGDVLFNGKSIKKLKTEELVKQGFFLTYQNPVEIYGLKIKTFLNMLKKKYDSNYDLEKLLGIVGLDNEILKRFLNYNFSGGEKKRLELLQMLVVNPKFVILDEIDSGVDMATLKLIANVILKYSEDKLVFIITHSEAFIDFFPDANLILFKNKKLRKIKYKDLKIITNDGFGAIK